MYLLCLDICCRVAPKNKIDFLENRFWVKNSRISLIFLLFFTTLLKIENYREVFTSDTLPPLPKYQLDLLSYQKRFCWRKSKHFYSPKRVITDTKKKVGTHHCKINTFIFGAAQNLKYAHADDTVKPLNLWLPSTRLSPASFIILF